MTLSVLAVRVRALALALAAGLATASFVAPAAVLAGPSVASSCVGGSGSIFRVGPGAQFGTLAAAVTAAAPGATICVAPGVYTNDFVNVNKQLKIVGDGGMAHFVATVSPPNRKGIFVTTATLEIENLEFSGARVPDRNGAGIRHQGGSLIVRNSYFHDNENGILGSNLGAASTVTIEKSRFERNGFGDGQSHGIYIGRIGSLTVRDSYFQNQQVGHHVKSRADKTTVENSTFEDGRGAPSAIPSLSIDLPEGGIGRIVGNTLIQRDGDGNPGGVNAKIVNYGGDTPKATNSLVVFGNTFVSDRNSAEAVRNRTTTKVSFVNNRLVNVASAVVGPSSQSGNVAGGFADFPLQAIRAGALTTMGDGVVLRADIVQRSISGSTLSILAQPHGIKGNSGIVELGGEFYVANDVHGIAKLDRALGTTTFYFGPRGISDIGTIGGNLLAGVFQDDGIYEYTTAGLRVREYDLAGPQLGVVGIDSFGGELYVGSYLDGDIHVFDLGGAELRRIATGIGPNRLSSLDFDPSTREFWATVGYGTTTPYLYHFAADGTRLFASGTIGRGTDGVVRNQSVPSPLAFAARFAAIEPAAGAEFAAAAVPEPGALVLFGAGLMALAFFVRRRAQARI